MALRPALTVLAVLAGTCLHVTPSPSFAAPRGTGIEIVCPADAPVVLGLAAREIGRYLYVRTGSRARIAPERGARGRPTMYVTTRDRHLHGVDSTFAGRAARLGPQEYLLHTVDTPRGRTLYIIGGDPIGALYGAYRFAEHLGVRFYLHGDVIPDARRPAELPVLDEHGTPLFGLRGIQPFHDFPEGPDWWDLDHYKAVLSQIVKMRMNFFGLHTYPEGRPNAEPTVWIGLPEDVTAAGDVTFAYPASYQNTLRGNWGYAPKKTSAYTLGASQLFDRDAFGSSVMADLCPRPETPEVMREVFHRAGRLLRAAFRHARQRGIRTCVGTETPLTIPKLVRERLKERGKDPADPAVVQELYRGMFLRVSRAYDLDYYWFWTPESWTWSSVKPEAVRAVISDVTRACAAARDVNAPFELATCGWVLGPQNDRALFDTVFPRAMPLSCINRHVGKDPVEPGFAQCRRPNRWAIPWLEDDPGLTSPQLWVGRMREDAYDALRYGCNGLMGIHWRTRILGPNVLALAWAAWDQSGWSPGAPAKPVEREGPRGGQAAHFPNRAIAGTDDDPIYQTVRYDVDGYRLSVPSGSYDVTLKFCEPHYREAGKRIFGVTLQGKRVIERLDIFAKVGPDRALDYTFEDVAVTGGTLAVDFVKIVEFPSIAGIVVTGPAATKRINCGGPAYREYTADWPPAKRAPRGLPAGDFYRDWALHQFGPEAAEDIARIFTKIDGRLPCPSDWVHGPGGFKPDSRPWEQVVPAYAFVEALGAIRDRVRGAGNRDRFDYWLNSFRYLKTTGRLRCTWARLQAAMKQAKAEPDPPSRKRKAAENVLPLRRKLVRDVEEAYGFLLLTVSTPGALGTIANWEQHILPGLLEKPGEELAALLEAPLPADAVLRKDYRGPPRLIVPTLRSSIEEGESLRLRILVLASARPRHVRVMYRSPMGTGGYQTCPAQHVARNVYRAVIPGAASGDGGIEYYVEAETAAGETVRFPATAPAMNQTLVTVPRSRDERTTP